MLCYTVSRELVLIWKSDLFTEAEERWTATIIRLITWRILKPVERAIEYKRIGTSWGLREPILGIIPNRLGLIIYRTVKKRNWLTSKRKTGPYHATGKSRKASNLKFSSQKAEDQIKYTSQKIKEQEISRMNEEIQ